MPKQSAGLLPYRERGGQLEVFLVHPGGPFWAKKDDGAWSITKGELDEGEEPDAAARREFKEETGFEVPDTLISLGTVKQSGGKVVHAFAASADFDAAKIVSNTFEMEWPPRSGKKASFPEVDRGNWFNLMEAATKINPAQAEFLTRLTAAIP